jgi:hypothetical protein
MKQLTLDKNWRKGLGTELGVFCVLLDYGVKKLNINKQLNNTNFEQYKKIFQVSDDELIINQTDVLENEITPRDLFKVYSPYFRIPNIKKDKKFIGISAYNDVEVYEGNGKEYPYCKYYSIEQYSLLYKHLKRLGWEVITLDNKLISIEEKYHLISNFCECVIGYEGGIAHFCHMLNIPYIMFPWKKKFDIKLLHIDNKTFFLDSFDQILKWNKSDLQKCINDLHNGLGNNELAHNSQLIKDRLSKIPNYFTDDERLFLSNR